MSLRHAILLLLVSLASPLAGVRGVFELPSEPESCGMSCCTEDEPSCCGGKEQGPKMTGSCGCSENPSAAHTLTLGLDWLPTAPARTGTELPGRPQGSACEQRPSTRAPEPPAKPPRR